MSTQIILLRHLWHKNYDKIVLFIPYGSDVFVVVVESTVV